jgi:biotin carboxyl carrier protein
VELQAVSGLSEFDRSAASIRLLSAALDEVSIRNEFTLWPPGDKQLRHATMAMRKLADSSRVDALVALPLRNASDEVIGAIVAEGVRVVIHESRQLAAWQAMAPPLSAALLARRQSEKHLWDYLSPPPAQRGWRRVILLAVLALVGMGALPFPHRVRTECRVEPVVRRFVVAPYTGRLLECRVEPGDLVEAGRVLAVMDDRELGFELASLVAERFRAAKERDTATADHDPSAAQMAALEMERLDARIALLRERTNNLAIVSPLAGVILKGELQDAEGAPVSVGQALFEVAPLDPIELELAIPADEIAWTREDLAVTARLDGSAAGRIHGTIRTVHPRAEIRDGTNVFIASVTLTNPDQSLRPGMSGRAWIRAGVRPLAWIWFHRAIQRTRMVMGW